MTDREHRYALVADLVKRWYPRTPYVTDLAVRIVDALDADTQPEQSKPEQPQPVDYRLTAVRNLTADQAQQAYVVACPRGHVMGMRDGTSIPLLGCTLACAWCYQEGHAVTDFVATKENMRPITLTEWLNEHPGEML